jgi:BRCT domain type II-containing protein
MGPAKLQKAEKLGVKILSEQEFIALIGSDEIPKVEEKVVEAQPIQASLF